MKPFIPFILSLAAVLSAQAAEQAAIRDKTFVAWVAPANLTQRGGGVLMIEDGEHHFDGIVFGEVAPEKWMAGSDGFQRTDLRQDAWPNETANAGTFVQIAIVYAGNEVIIYRDGEVYSRYTIKEPLTFGLDSSVLIGPRFSGGPDFFSGAIDDARIYDRALTAEQIAALKPGVPSDPKPWAWWTFDDEACRDRMENFADMRLTPGAEVVDGKLCLDGAGGFFRAAHPANLGEKSAPEAPDAAQASQTAFLYAPPAGTGGDVIPYYSDGKFHILHMVVKRGAKYPGGECVEWNQLVTSDFVSFEDTGVAIPRGGAADSEDLDIWTGSVVVKDGVSHAFYTGHNASFLKQGKPDQVILRAVSRDGVHWTKEPGFRFTPEGHASYHYLATPQSKVPGACRDPFVFWNPEGKEYGMLFMASPEGGGLAYAGSDDLDHWRLDEPFPVGKRFGGYECPDLFRIGNLWYLLFSTFDQNPGWATRYLSSPSLQGPWKSPADNFLDGGSLYAAKTVSDGKRRFLCGTLTSRKDKRDDGENAWGGRLLMYELMELEPGKLGVRIPVEVEESFGAQVPIALPNSSNGTLPYPNSRMELGKLPGRCLLNLKLKVPETGRAGVWVGGSQKEGFRFFVDAATQRMAWDRGALPLGANPEKERPWRPLKFQPGDTLSIKIALDGDAAVACVNDNVCLSTRIYDRRENTFGVWSDVAGTKIENLALRTRAEPQPR